MILHNPTGGGIRSDPAGDGHFGASRGNRKHEGLDFLCAPGQIVRAVIAGKLVRAYPYAGDVIFAGCRLWGKDFMAKMFYFIPHAHRINEDVLAGEEIGIAQDISAKYGGGMLAHIHVAIYSLNPTRLRNPEDHLDTEENRLKNGGVLMDNLKILTKFVNQHKGELCLDCDRVVRLIGFVDDPEDYFYDTIDLHGKKTWVSCVGALIPLKGVLPDRVYRRLNKVFKMNDRAETQAE